MINPSEISEVLKQQLESVNKTVAFEEVGTVLEVGDGVAHVYGLDNVCANELVEFENGVKGVALNLEESNVGVILLNDVNKVTENMSVRRTGEIASHSLQDPDQLGSLRPVDAKFLVDRKYILASMGLLGQHYPDIALRIMKKELVEAYE